MGEDALRTYVELAVPYEVAGAPASCSRALAAVGEAERAAAELRLAADACVTMGASTLLAAAEGALAALPPH